jgi:hypothetical protein
MTTRGIHFRCPDNLFYKIEKEARIQKVNLTDIIVTAIAEYVERGPDRQRDSKVGRRLGAGSPIPIPRP